MGKFYNLTPKEIVAELDKYIIGQESAKKSVAIALRNRHRRNQLSDEMREEVTPKNILMVGPTGCGKTEIARRLAKIMEAPFVKVEATKFTEVGSGSFTINDVLNISTYGGSYSQVITLPSSPSFIGKRVCIVNNNYPPYTKTSLAYYTTIQVDATLQSNYIGIGGNIDVDASGGTEPQAIKSIAIRGGVVELLAVPANWADDRYSRWIVVSGKHSIMYYTTM